jgi:iron complex outermembrane recepter protein
MKLLYLVTILSISFFTSTAQNVNLNITVLGKANEKLSNANIVLSLFTDSSIVQKKQTNTEGKISLSVLKNNKYVLVITSIGFEDFKKVISVAEADINLQIGLKTKKLNNNAVVVVGKKPLIRQEDDKTIVDPENLVQTSTNAFEVLEKTPGIFVDQDGNFYLSSTTPATIQINGRDMRLGANDLATLIKSLPPNSIQKIEIVRTPSAKNDATGSGGVINIVLKKGVKLGFAGSVFGGLNQGSYGNQFIGASLSNSNDKKSTYAYIGISRRNNYDEINSNRNFTVDSLLKQNSFNKTNAVNPYANFGINYMPNKKWDLGYDANLSYNKAENSSVNYNNISKISTNNIFVNNDNRVNNTSNNINISQNLSAKYKSDSGKIEWNNSISFNYFDYGNDQTYTTQYALPSSFQILGNGAQNSNRSLFVVQTDLTWKPIKRFTVETGAKTSFIHYKNDAKFFKNNVTDAARSNQFKYKENITALYLQAAKTIEKFVIKAGVRMEYTNMQGTQLVPSTQKFTINRTDFFPYAYLSRPIVTIFKYDLKGYLVYRKSITRPGYDLLNPFSRFVDNYLSEVGNPNLKPQFTETFEANLSFEDQPVFAIGKNTTKGIFTNVIYQNPANPSEALRTYDNLGNNTENYLRFTAAIPPGGKYFFVVGGQRNFNTYRGLYENKPLEFSNKSWNLFTYHQLNLDKRSVLSVQGWMQLGGLYQFYELNDFGQLNVSINRQFLKKKLTVTLNVRDVFFTNNNAFKLAQGTVNAFGTRQSDTRRFGINIRYNFGVKKKEEQPANYNGRDSN